MNISEPSAWLCVRKTENNGGYGLPLTSAGPFRLIVENQDIAEKYKKNTNYEVTALYSEPRMHGWQPIETAPKGRIIFVGYWNELNKWRTLRACYYLPGTLEAYEDYDESFMNEGWYEESDESDVIYMLHADPTHWMPLPEPPEKSCI
jgi:hypothetical protein